MHERQFHVAGVGATEGEKPEVCGKSQTCRTHDGRATLLPAVSLREIGGVVEGSGICRILPFCESGSAGKTEICRPDPYFELPRPAVLLQKNRLCSAVSDFSPHFRIMRQNRASGSGKRAKHTPSQDAIKKGMPSIWKEPPCRTSANERLLFFVALIAWHVDNHLDMTVMSIAPQPSSGTIDRSLR